MNITRIDPLRVRTAGPDEGIFIPTVTRLFYFKVYNDFSRCKV